MEESRLIDPASEGGEVGTAEMRGNTRPTVVDLFAGCGLFGYAFRREGFALKQAYEIDAVAATTYWRNLRSEVSVVDVRRVKPEGRADVLIAGPPCQGFSTLGKRDPWDPRNQLSLLVAGWAKKLRPRVVVVENVSSFLDSPVAGELRRRLGRAGYEVRSFVLDAYEFGVPQRRRRSFVVASEVGFCEPAPLRLKSRSRTVRGAWAGLPEEADGRNQHYAPKPSELALARMQAIPPGGDKRDVMASAPELTPPSWWRIGCQVTDAWGRLVWDEPSNTLRTCLQNASKGRYIHPEEHRVISLREAARLHSVGDEWYFEGLPTQVARQIGNSVPVNLGRSVARSVMQALN